MKDIWDAGELYIVLGKILKKLSCDVLLGDIYYDEEFKSVYSIFC